MAIPITIDKFIAEKSHPENTVHYGKTKRFEKAKQQREIPAVEKERIIELTNEFIKAYGLNIHDGDNLVETDNIDLIKFNRNIKSEYSGITSEKDIIWMKFTSNGSVGVVACSNDINFDIPANKCEYDKVEETKNGRKKRWKYNTSGILVHSVGLTWNTDFFLIFPLLGLKEGKEGKKQRHDLETGIGNYLIYNNVPIIDYYSHRF